MPPFLSNKKLIVLLASLIILVALVGFSVKERKQMTWPEQFAHDTVGWFQQVFNRPAQYVAGFFDNINDIENAYKENKALKANLEDYAKVKSENMSIKHENKVLKKEVGLLNDPDLADFKKHPARVISRSYDKWNQIIMVNKGAQDGIKPDMAVITADGFIGKVKGVSQFSSEVILTTNTGNVNQISAKVQGSRIFGMIEGYDIQKNVLQFKKIPVKAKVKVGQMVVTSGLGGIFPEGLIIGKVKSVSTDQYDLTKVAEVQPAANLNDLTHVVIVERLSQTAVGDMGKKKGDK